jgi:ABC-type hemin transport system ATPase subunit
MVVLSHGRVVAEGPPDTVLASDECARAFEVVVRGHAVSGLAHALYSFEEERR